MQTVTRRPRLEEVSPAPSDLDSPRFKEMANFNKLTQHYIQAESAARRNSGLKPSQRSVSYLSELEISIKPSLSRFHLGSAKQEVSRFRKQVENHGDLNTARRNMINWV